MGKLKWLVIIVGLMSVVMACAMTPKAAKVLTVGNIINRYDKAQIHKSVEAMKPVCIKTDTLPLLPMERDGIK